MNWLSHLFSSDANTPEWDAGAQLVDVRSGGEYASGHVDGALHLSLDRFVQNHAAALPDKSKQIILYCQSGARSGQATQFLQQQGYANVINGGSAGAVAMKTNRRIIRS